MGEQMKAKECAEIYNQSDDKNAAIGEIGAMFIKDTSKLIKDRKINSASGLNGVLREQRMKWIAFCRQIGGELKEEGFQIIVTNEFPELARYF